jgi:UDPglucose--hexose-1-phosphate uridylyltransferase
MKRCLSALEQGLGVRFSLLSEDFFFDKYIKACYNYHNFTATMSEMRFNPITLDWVIMAPNRALRPNDFRKDPPERTAPRGNCPFCPGNEHLAPPEIARVEDPAGGWAVRVIPNKFSVLTPAGDLERRVQGTFRSMAAAGAHEVVIENSRHDLSLGDMTPGHMAAILRIYRERFQALAQDPAVESIVIFKNHGERAGSSLKHPHSQIMAAPVLSSQVCMRLQEARRFHELNGTCLYCQVLEEELLAEERVVEAGKAFVAFVPYASLSPYHIWIFPRCHAPSFGSISDEDISELAGVLRRQLRRLKLAAGDPDYNFTIRSAPVSETASGCFHWYLAIVPRVNRLAGFELGSGSYINGLLPEHSAELLRGTVLES